MIEKNWDRISLIRLASCLVFAWVAGAVFSVGAATTNGAVVEVRGAQVTRRDDLHERAEARALQVHEAGDEGGFQAEGVG